MERAALLERLSVQRTPIRWGAATVRETIAETAHARTIVLDAGDWPGHVAGQHLDLRLTAEDGYQAQRSYSIASAPEDATVAITVERIDDGEVSPYLTEELRAGDELEIRGPVGGHFTWSVGDGGPLLLVAGGSGVVPLMAMLRHLAAHDGAPVDARLLLSARRWDDVLYRTELEALAGRADTQVAYTLTREQPAGWAGYARRVDADMLAAVGPPPSARPRAFVCGPTAFVEQAADALIELGHPAAAVRTERFGPTG
jgi:ferredoxin-NADP reductase